MTQREFRSIEEFEGFGENPTIDDVTDAILEFGPQVLIEDVFLEPLKGIRLSAQAVLISMSLTFSQRQFDEDAAYRRRWEAKRIYDNRRRAA